MAGDPVQQAAARQQLAAAAENVSTARRLAQEGKNGDALRYWREEIFGPLFPLS
jgi:hypothetical protein